MDNIEIESIIRLLDDPDKNVYEPIRLKLTQMGPKVIPILEKAWENSLDTLLQSRIENIIHDIHFEQVKTKLQQWIATEQHDLLNGALIIGQYQYPELDIHDIQKKVELFKRDVWLEINENLTALEKIKIINHILFDVHGFSRNTSFNSSVHSNFIHQIIESKKGSPIALAILFAAIAQQLNMPVFGVALPKNFILCYRDANQDAFQKEFDNDVLFYINPFNKGVVFGKTEIELFIKQQKLENKPAYFQPCSNKETLIHLVKALIEFYETNADILKTKEYNALLKILYL